MKSDETVTVLVMNLYTIMTWAKQSSLLVFLDAFAEDLDLLLDLNPQHEVIQVTTLVIIKCYSDPLVLEISHEIPLLLLCALLSLACQRQQGSHECLLHIGKAKLVGDIGNGLAELVGKVDVLVVLEFALPKVTVGDALLEIRVGEQVFSVKA
jgi:hypothetical protein